MVEQAINGKWVEVAKIKGYKNATYTVKGLTAGTSYKFRVKGYLTYKSKELYGFTQSVSVTTAK